MEGTLKFPLQLLAVGQMQLVFRDEEPVVEAGKSVFDQSMIPRGAKQDADGRVVVSSGEFLYNPQNAFERLSKQRAPSKVLDAVRHLLQFICFPYEKQTRDDLTDASSQLVAIGNPRVLDPLSV